MSANVIAAATFEAVVIRQLSGAVNGLQFRVQDLEDAVKALQERLDKRGD